MCLLIIWDEKSYLYFWVFGKSNCEMWCCKDEWLWESLLFLNIVFFYVSVNLDWSCEGYYFNGFFVVVRVLLNINYMLWIVEFVF